MATFTVRRFDPVKKKKTRYPLNSWLSVPQRWAGRFEQENIPLMAIGTFQPVAWALFRILCVGSVRMHVLVVPSDVQRLDF